MKILSSEPLNEPNANAYGYPSSSEIIKIASVDAEEVLKLLHTTSQGLTTSEAHKHLIKYGLNEVTKEKRQHWLTMLFKTFKDPLIIMLLFIGIISFYTKDIPATVVIVIIMLVSVLLKFFREFGATTSAQKLKAMVKTTATVLRHEQKKEVPINLLVTGDIVHLSAGDMVPADVRIITSKDLFINQAVLTGESLPVDKHAPKVTDDIKNPLELSNICFMGTNVESGTAMAVVVSTGKNTYFGSIA